MVCLKFPGPLDFLDPPAGYSENDQDAEDYGVRYQNISTLISALKLSTHVNSSINNDNMLCCVCVCVCVSVCLSIMQAG